MTEPVKAEPNVPIIEQPKVVQDDPLIIEYASSLQKELGEFYDADFDKLPVKERINQMKIVKKTIDKMPKRSEGAVPISPEPEGLHKQKNVLERWQEGYQPSRTSVFSISKNA